MTLVTCRALTKTYGSQYALHDINFSLHSGTVTGLVGPNGSGKTTLMRVLAGLGRPSSGTVLLDGRQPSQRGRESPRVGAFLGTHNLHGGRSVRETICLAAYLSGLPPERAHERLDWCDLGSVSRRLVKSLSLGMRVRLGLSIATISDPEVLLLDEPMNGLDVEGIQWVKSVVSEHRSAGGVALISSHLLHELEAIVDRALILSKGILARDILIGGQEDAPGSALVRVSDDDVFRAHLSSTTWPHHFEDGLWTVDSSPDAVGRLAQVAGVYVRELRAGSRASLENIFLDVTEGEFSPSRGGREN